jgi:hypothetical protein
MRDPAQSGTYGNCAGCSWPAAIGSARAACIRRGRGTGVVLGLVGVDADDDPRLTTGLNPGFHPRVLATSSRSSATGYRSATASPCGARLPLC